MCSCVSLRVFAPPAGWFRVANCPEVALLAVHYIQSWICLWNLRKIQERLPVASVPVKMHLSDTRSLWDIFGECGQGLSDYFLLKSLIHLNKENKRVGSEARQSLNPSSPAPIPWTRGTECADFLISISSPLVSLVSRCGSARHSLAPHSRLSLQHMSNVMVNSQLTHLITTTVVGLRLHYWCMLYRSVQQTVWPNILSLHPLSLHDIFGWQSSHMKVWASLGILLINPSIGSEEPFHSSKSPSCCSLLLYPDHKKL